MMKLVKCGVPQGFILGPLLFLIYNSGLSNLCSCSNLILLLDDTHIYDTHIFGKIARGMVMLIKPRAYFIVKSYLMYLGVYLCIITKYVPEIRLSGPVSQMPPIYIMEAPYGTRFLLQY